MRTFVSLNSEKSAERGRQDASGGKEYIVQDGDVVHSGSTS